MVYAPALSRRTPKTRLGGGTALCHGVPSPWREVFEELSTLATELTRLSVDVIVTSSTPAALTAKRLTDTIPIVMAGNSRPVKRGLIASLAQPGGNVTGLTNSPGGDWNWPGKRMEVLQEAVPQVVRVGILASSLKSKRMSQEDVQAFVSRWQTMAQSIGLTAVPVIVYRAEDYPRAFATLTQRQIDALYVHAHAQNVKHEQLIVDFATTQQLPTIFGVRTSVEAGGLMSYAVDWDDLRRRTAHYVDKILKGVKPADLPVEEPAKFDLVINLKTPRR